jgi:hypothetical protein
LYLIKKGKINSSGSGSFYSLRRHSCCSSPGNQKLALDSFFNRLSIGTLFLDGHPGVSDSQIGHAGNLNYYLEQESS